MQVPRQLISPRQRQGMGQGMGWQSCIPFDTDNLTGEPIVQCDSVSDQMPCPAGVPQYPGEGYCPSTVNGYVPELFARITTGLAGRHGLGDVLCPDGTSQATLNDCIGHGLEQSPCPFGFVFDDASGTCLPVPVTAPLPPDQAGSGSGSTPAPVTTSLPPITIAIGSPCPAGYVLGPGNAVCIPAAHPVATTPAAAGPNWFLLGGVMAFLFVVVAVANKR